jgi:DNA (cytosine-5)-methyltransferase 1
MLVENKNIKSILTEEKKQLPKIKLSDSMFNKNIKQNLKTVENQIDEINKYNNNILSNDYRKSINTFFLNRQNEEIKNYSNHNTIYEFIDLFSGAGGLSLGLEKSGLFPKLALDKDTSSLKTYAFNRPYLNSDQILNEDIKIIANEHNFFKVPLVVGGPPCQGFSNANKQKKENDDRNSLYKFYVQTVEKSNPDIFLLENVEGILKFINVIEQDFKNIGYTLKPFLLNTSDFGFAQNRKRVFLVGISNNQSKIFNELYDIFSTNLDNNRIGKKFMLWDVISDLPKINAKTISNSTLLENDSVGYTFGKFHKKSTKYTQILNDKNLDVFPILNHKAKYNNERDIKIYSLLEQGEGSDSKKIIDINPYANRNDIFKDKFFKLRSDEPSKTITAHMYYDCHMYIHPFSSRGLSPREAARVQGFPDDYLFLGTPNEWYRQIGNAVSPLIGKIIGEGLTKMLDRIYEK